MTVTGTSEVLSCLERRQIQEREVLMAEFRVEATGCSENIGT